MKKRFSTRNPTASDTNAADASSTNTELETSSTASSQYLTTGEEGQQKGTSKRNSLGRKVVQIDKVFSPEASSGRVFQSPTRFPRRESGLAALSTMLTSASSESDDATQTGTRGSASKTRGKAKRHRGNDQGEERNSQSSSEKSADDPDQRILSSYPSEWPGPADEGSEEMAERYAALRARLFTLSGSLSVAKQQCEQYKALADALQGINTNLEKCSSEDLQEEVKRTGDLVSKIQQKLESRDLTRASQETSGDSNRNNGDSAPPTSPAHPPTDHAALVKVLFKAAATVDSP
ncbi:uncharacterized protein LOC110984382 isoform X2 [Acanthaster planci]|nr:uncharacterized protein LOC110984382 isoform X2 [Acanthaster planci]